MAVNRKTGKIREREVGKTQYGYWGQLYDSISLPDGPFTGEKIFYTVPFGQSDKTRSDTNMSQGGVLPAGEVFQVNYIKLMVNHYRFALTAATADGPDPTVIKLFLQRAFLTFFINNKIYYEAPLTQLPLEYGIWVPHFTQGGAAASTVFPVSNGIKGDPEGYRIRMPKVLESTAAFRVTITWDDSVTLAGGGAPGSANEPKLFIIFAGPTNRVA